VNRVLARLRSFDPTAVDAALAVVFSAAGVATVFMEGIRDDGGRLIGGFREPGALSVLTVILTCAPTAVRRRVPLVALGVSSAAIFAHFVANWPAGFLPFATLFLTYSAGSLCTPRRAIAGLAVVVAAIIGLGIADPPGLDRAGAIGVLAQFTAAWALGVAMRNRRAATEAVVRQADDRAEAERQSAARMLAEERLRIAQELHDVVAHSMSVIAVQAGVGAHVLDDRPEQARAVLDNISATSRGTLAEMRRLLGVLRDEDGARSHVPAPGLADLPRLVSEVQAAGVPATLHVVGETGDVPAGVGMSAYRVVQEALTNVIKHAGQPSRVDVTVRREDGSVAVEVLDDGRGLAAARPEGPAADGSGHGLIGMRERVEVWGGELLAGAAPGGGFRVCARLPYGDAR
jgi:signal transduction histidine kinase